jgi:photosystem II stability/assembly factor-like uncharacterized protein
MDQRERKRVLGVFGFLVLIAVTNPVILAAQQQLQPALPGPTLVSPAGAAHADIVRRRTEWFYGQRAYPQPTIPAGARLSALNEMNVIIRNQASPAGPPAGSPSTQWTLIGPRPTNNTATSYWNYGASSGRITAIAVDPANSNNIYIGAAEGGVWKTTDGGTTWNPLTDTQPSLSFGSLAIDPTNSSIIYAGTGEADNSGDSYYGAGILKSTDGGSTWTQLGASTFGTPFNSCELCGGAKIGALAVDPSNNQVLLAGVQLSSTPSLNGIYRSADGATTWVSVLSGATGSSVFFDPTNGNIAYAALGTAGGSNVNGIYKSTNAGLTWSLVATGAGIGRISLAIAPSNTSTLYAAIASTSGSFYGAFKSTNSGANWTTLPFNTDDCNNQCDYDMPIAVSPTNANLVLLGESANYNAVGLLNGMVFLSSDGGTTWSDITVQGGTNLHPDQHAITFSGDGSQVFIGDDGGIWSNKPLNLGSWTNLNAPLAITQFYPGLSIDPANLSRAFGGTQDNGDQQYSGSVAWTGLQLFGDGGWTAMNSTSLFAAGEGLGDNNGIILVEKCPLSNLNSCARSDSGITINDRAIFMAPLVMDPLNNQTLYYGTYRVYQTTNGAGSWTVLPNSDLTGNVNAAITTLVVAPNNSNTVYAGTSNSKVLVTTNAGTGAASTWTDRSTGLPPRYVTQVAVDPANSQIAYVTFSGFSGFGGDTAGHVFKTTTGGAGWTDISGSLPNVPVNDIVIDRDISGTLYVATDIGVFSTSNGGSTWGTLSTGLPRVVVSSLKLHEMSRTLRAGTYGRSVWDLPVPSSKKRRGQITSQ